MCDKGDCDKLAKEYRAWLDGEKAQMKAAGISMMNSWHQHVCGVDSHAYGNMIATILRHVATVEMNEEGTGGTLEVANFMDFNHFIMLGMFLAEKRWQLLQAVKGAN